MTESVSAQELAGFVPLNALNPEHLKELAGKARRVEIKSGKTLFRKGDDTPQQWYLLKGTVELAGEDGKARKIEGGTAAARNGLEPGRPAGSSAIARTDITVITVDRNLLDLMLTWDQTGSYSVEELGGEDEGDDGDADWMTRMLQTEAFMRIPPANIQAIFMRMEPVTFSTGDKVIEQGAEGDYFYIIRDGRCLVTRKTKAKPDGIRLAELGPGDSFGEEALISSKERNATITMLTNGTLMRLSKEDFNALLKEPLQEWITYKEAVDKVAQGNARWLDVRLPAEFENSRIRGAINLPLFFLRMKARQLDADTLYIVYCDTSRRSSAASFLLNERGLKTLVLKGGMEQVPADALESAEKAES